tara:strand:+ start:2910 stop:3356 length:447 start_codon:yes stop_codon:yes gene_type:complete
MKRFMKSWNSYLQESEDMPRVSKAVMFNESGDVLILKRSPKMVSDASPWEWDLPGGHIEKGEKNVQGLAREIKEETSLTIPRAPSWFMLSKNTRFYIIKEWSGQIALSDEHVDYKWISPEEAKQYNLGRRYLHAVIEAEHQYWRSKPN